MCEIKFRTTPESKLNYICTKLIFVNRIISVFIIAFTFSACAPNNVTEDPSLEKFFKENNVQGSFGLFDNGQGRFTIYNPGRFRDTAFLPASTYKIVNSLIGIESGRATDTNMVIAWNGIKSNRAECDMDMNMSRAFRVSCVNWYQELARRIGKDTMQKWVDTLGYARRYGKFTITNNVDNFWLDNTAKVTADEQLGLAKRLYFDQLPFQKRTQRMVRGMMLQENNSNYKLSYKTGWAVSEKGHAIGWVVGWIEENVHPYFFVLQLESSQRDFDMGGVRLKMLKDILKQYGFMEGKR